MNDESRHETTATPQPTLPPIDLLAVVTMVLVIAAGIVTAAYLPRPVPLMLPLALVVAAALVLIINIVLLSRLRDFAWDTFFVVGRWALLAYLVIAGLLIFVFITDHTPRRALAVLVSSLVLFGVDVPLLFAFSVARYQPGRRALRE
jgi:drug/metabolite transporter (DMT)-like permease